MEDEHNTYTQNHERHDEDNINTQRTFKHGEVLGTKRSQLCSLLLVEPGVPPKVREGGSRASGDVCYVMDT